MLHWTETQYVASVSEAGTVKGITKLRLSAVV